jgi:hypothetical protein
MIFLANSLKEGADLVLLRSEFGEEPNHEEANRGNSWRRDWNRCDGGSGEGSRNFAQIARPACGACDIRLGR